MSFHCVGCDSSIDWNGKDSFCYTCPCGGHIFYDDTLKLAPPASLVIAIYEKRDLPHLDYLVGNSNFTSPLKEKLIEELKSLGAVWMKDCEQCQKDGTYQRALDREKREAVFQAEAILWQQKLNH